MKPLLLFVVMAAAYQCTPQEVQRAPQISDGEGNHGNEVIESFAQAKKKIYALFAARQRTFYCGCAYTDRVVDHGSCGYVVRNNVKRARRTEVEHVVPAHAFGRSFPEWRQGHKDCVSKSGKKYRGRNCVRKVSPKFRRMEADLYNLQPAIGEVNADRSNYSMALLGNAPGQYGACDVQIADRKIQPRRAIRGDIARTYLYMHWAYPGRGIIGKKRRALFEAWDKQDPVDTWEHTRVRTIEALQKNVNPFVGKPGSSGAGPRTK